MKTETAWLGHYWPAVAGMGIAPAAAEDIVLSIGARGYGPSVEANLADFKKANPDINVEWNKVPDVPNDCRASSMSPR